MSFSLAHLDLMQFLWDATDKAGGTHLEYAESDINDLWRVGFIDTQKFSLLEWKKVALPFRQANGSYRFNHQQFMSLDIYRYKGELFVPFDAMKINEGFYSDQGIQELFDTSIKPSITVPEHEYTDYIKNFKEKYRDANSKLIRIDHDAKNFIRILLEMYPSPLRNLELIFDHLVHQHKYGSSAKLGAGIAKQVSTFRDRPANKVEAEALGLKDLMKTKTKNTSVPAVEKDKTVSLKTVRRAPRGTRG